MNDPRRFTMEHRWGKRAACRLTVRVSAATGAGGIGRLRDVSMSGAFIETTAELPLDTRIELAVLPVEPARCEMTVMANVVRTERDGVGVEWSELPAGPVCAMLGCVTRCAAASANT